MINNAQFRESIVWPALEVINLYSDDAEELLVATMAHESKGGTYITQINGPALGIYQMEPATFNWIWADISRTNPTMVTAILGRPGLTPFNIIESLVYDLRFATQMARLKYFTVPAALPKANDIDGIWNMYKTYYNTSKGEAEKEEFLTDYFQFIGRNQSNG